VVTRPFFVLLQFHIIIPYVIFLVRFTAHKEAEAPLGQQPTEPQQQLGARFKTEPYHCLFVHQ
jgi:hypothetical protein